MANRKTFNDFEESKPVLSDYIIGFSKPEPGGERRFRLSDLKGFIYTSDVVKVEGTTVFSSDDVINGKLYHVGELDQSAQDEIVVSLPLNPDHPMQFGIVNMATHKPVRIVTQSGSSLQARGELLRKKFDTAIIYWDGETWNAYGDLSKDGGLGIKDITEDYTFTLEDVDALLHARATNNITVSLPDPTNILSGTQFYVYNLSDSSIVTLNSTTDAELFARASSLRRKYDDAVIYTDGTSWFATGDLS